MDQQKVGNYPLQTVQCSRGKNCDSKSSFFSECPKINNIL